MNPWSSTGTNRKRRYRVPISPPGSDQATSSSTPCTLEPRKHPDRIHYNDPTKVQISVRCYVLHRKRVQQHSSQIYANSTIKNGHQQVHAYRSTIRTVSLCRYAVSELWPIQGSSKNKLLVGHLRKMDVIGDNLRVELDCLQLQAGVSWMCSAKRAH
jgi:hypothetical protein